MKKIFLTSAICMTFAAPALADIAANASGATCNTDTLGTGSGSATLEAKWEAKHYSCIEGKYLRASDATCATCTAGNYCTGAESNSQAAYNEDLGDYYYLYNGSDKGISECPSGYPNSADGAINSTDCYKTTNVTCSTWNPYNGGHGTANYANSSNGIASAKTYLEIDYDDYDNRVEIDGQTILDTANACDITSLTCDTGYTSTNGPLSEYVNTNPSSSNRSNGTFEVTWSNGTVVHGIAKASATDGIYGNSGNPSDTAGDYCWCAMTGYNIAGGALQTVASPVWIRCQEGIMGCEMECAIQTEQIPDYRAALFGDIGRFYCKANSISITWDPKNGENSTSNSCTYDGAITMPATPEKTGYTFNGWKLK